MTTASANCTDKLTNPRKLNTFFTYAAILYKTKQNYGHLNMQHLSRKIEKKKHTEKYQWTIKWSNCNFLQRFSCLQCTEISIKIIFWNIIMPLSQSKCRRYIYFYSMVIWKKNSTSEICLYTRVNSKAIWFMHTNYINSRLQFIHVCS